MRRATGRLRMHRIINAIPVPILEEKCPSSFAFNSQVDLMARHWASFDTHLF